MNPLLQLSPVEQQCIQNWWVIAHKRRRFLTGLYRDAKLNHQNPINIKNDFLFPDSLDFPKSQIMKSPTLSA